MTPNDIFTRITAVESVRKVYQLKSIEAGSTWQQLTSIPSRTGAIPCADADGIVYLAFTSGTTGDPKGVLHSNNTLLANARALAKDWHFDQDSGDLQH